MADGSTCLHDGNLRLAQVGAHGLVGRCPAPACGVAEEIDATPWIRLGLGDLPLRAFETRLRCVCGSRRINLELGPAVQSLGAGLIYRFW